MGKGEKIKRKIRIKTEEERGEDEAEGIKIKNVAGRGVDKRIVERCIKIG